MRKALIAVSAGLIFIIGAVPLAKGVTMTIDDRTETPTFDLGLGGPVIPVSESFQFSVPSVPGTFTGVNVRFIILDPGTDSVSDIFSLTVTPNVGEPTTHVAGTFLSDSAEVPLTYVPNPDLDQIITETGAFQIIYSSPDLTEQNPDLVIQFASDVESVPEPATLALLGFAFAGMGLARRRIVPAASAGSGLRSASA